MILAIGSLAAVGLVIASYFTAVAFHWMTPATRWIPSFCRLEERTCASVIFTPSARVFGPPNSLLGQLFYLALLAGTVSDWLTDPRLWTLYLGVSLLTVGFGVYLSYALLFVLRVPCPLCFTSHGINAVICGLLLLLRTAG